MDNHNMAARAGHYTLKTKGTVLKVFNEKVLFRISRTL